MKAISVSLRAPAAGRTFDLAEHGPLLADLTARAIIEKSTMIVARANRSAR